MKSLIILLSAFTLLTNLEIVSSDLASFLDKSPILVLADGEDKPECGDMEGMSGCKTIAHACGLGANPREIVVDAGIFIEEVGIMVEGSLTVTGQSTGGCAVSKTSSPFVLFNVSAAGADLMLAHMTVLLVSHAAQGSFVWCADGNETVYVTFRGCRFTGQSGTESGDGRSVSVAISGQCVYIDNPAANLLIDGCTVYNITCTQFSFIYCMHVAALQITKSSFANVHNTNRTGSGGGFYLEYVRILTLRLSFFVGCSAIKSGGVGCGQGLTESGSAISSCAFWNSSATFGGVLEILSSSFDSTLDIANISCTYCIARLDGGALVFDNLKFAISFSTFRKCTCARCGGAVVIIGQSLVEITRCVFANCRSSGTESGDGGGALYMSGSTASLKYIVFVENEASKGSDMFLILMIQVDIPSECYSDKEEAVSLSCASACPVGIIYASIYASVTCRYFITNNLPYDGERCAMPCSGSLSADSTTTTCTLLCCPNYVSVNGACVPECEFWTGADGTADSNETDVCGPLCVRDTSRGYPLCGSAVACAGQNLVRPEVAGGGCQLRECADRTIGTGAGIDTDTDANTSTDTVAEMLPAQSLPCGSEDCFQQINIAGENLRTCDLACPRTYAYASSSPDSGTCLLLQCSKRTVDSNTTVDFPCGSDCFVDSPHPGGGGRKRNCTEGECTRPDLYERDARSGYCVEKGDPGTESNTSTGDGEDGEDERKHPRGLSTGHMIIVVVVPIFAVAVVAIGIIIFFLVRWRKRKNMSFSSSSSSRELFPQKNVTNPQPPSFSHKNKTPPIAIVTTYDERSNLTKILEYEVIKRLGGGSCGNVFEVKKGGKSFAIKQMSGNQRKTNEPEQAFTSENFKPLYLQEASKFLVKYYETIDDKVKGVVYIVMELCRKGDLHELISRAKSANKDIYSVWRVFIQLLLGLNVLHSNNLLHRDLKPHNIFITEEDIFKIGDYGTVKEIGRFMDSTHTFIGTLVYMAPEKIERKDYSFPADMWALGCVLYELIMMECPFNPAEKDYEQKILRGEYPRIPEGRCDSQLQELVDLLLSVNPEARPTTTNILKDQLIRSHAGDLLEYFPEELNVSST